MKAHRRLPLALLVAVAVAALAAGCGSSGSGDYGGSHPDYAGLAKAPGPLAKLYGEGDDLLSGGTSAFEARLAALHGYPVVVNNWASWCGPCREEFPTFQKLAARYGTKVAFLGVNSEDGDDSATTFLEEAPVPYPSFEDPSSEIARSIGVPFGLPNTAYYDAAGKLVYLKRGQYANQSDLEADVRKYALRAS